MTKKLLPALLVTGSLTGVGAVMTGLLMLAPPVDDGSRAVPMAARGVIEVDVRNAGALQLPPSVGPGGVDAGGQPLPPAPAGSEAPPPPAAETAGEITPFTATDPGEVRPVRIRIPKIRVNAAIEQVGMDAERALAAPPLTEPGLAGWYRFSPVPGEIGPAIINGHVSTREGPAVFSRLRELSKGDLLYIARSDGKVARFTVSGIEQAGQSSFPTERVYGNTPDAQVRLITCGGVYDAKAHAYTDNVIVYATLSRKKE